MSAVINRAADWFSKSPAERRAILAPFVKDMRYVDPEDAAAEEFERNKERLAESPDFIAEFGPTNEDAEAIAKALRDGDLLEVGRLYWAALERDAAEMVERRADERRIHEYEAAEQLVEIYREDAA